MHALVLYRPHRGRQNLYGALRAPWVDIRFLFKTAHEQPVRSPRVWCDRGNSQDPVGEIWWRYVNAFEKYPWSSIQTTTHTQTVKQTYLPKCKFLQVIIHISIMKNLSTLLLVMQGDKYWWWGTSPTMLIQSWSRFHSQFVFMTWLKGAGQSCSLVINYDCQMSIKQATPYEFSGLNWFCVQPSLPTWLLWTGVIGHNNDNSKYIKRLNAC